MIAHFYLLAVSFHNNDNLNRDEIEEKIKRLSEDIMLIDQYKETNKRYVNYSEIYDQVLYADVTVGNVICREKELERDVFNSLQNIVQKSQPTDDTFDIVRLFQHDEQNCYGLIAFHKIDGVDDELHLIYGKDEWYKFRRRFLGLYPGEADYFIEECKKYFPCLFFHERNKNFIGTILDDCPKKIIYHLSALNDKFHECKEQGVERAEILRRFSIYAQLDEHASLEGNVSRKNDFTFKFDTNDGHKEDVCCEPHLKLTFSDHAKFSNDRRIYFHEGKSNIHDGKILIGHIGKHL